MKAAVVVTKSGRTSTGLGAVLIAHLQAVGSATTDELVAASKAERATVSSRLWWLANKEGRLVCEGKGQAKTWSLPPTSAPADAKAPKQSKAKPEAPKAAEAKPEPKKKVAVAKKKPAAKKAGKK